MKETEFATFLSCEHEDLCKQPSASRPSVDTLVGTFIDKQTNMESDNEFNKLSMEQAQILSLLAKYDDKGNNNTSKKRIATNNYSEMQTKYQPSPWRTRAPKDGTPLEKVINGGHTSKWDLLEIMGLVFGIL